MPLSPTVVEEKIKTTIAAWEDLRPAKSFAGLTLAQFKTAMQPALDARTTISNLENLLSAARTARDDEDKEACDIINKVVNAVVGDTDEGNDSPLYEALGYIRKSQRKSGLKRTIKLKQAA